MIFYIILVDGDFLGMHHHNKQNTYDLSVQQWSGSYYISDGEPDISKPYSGVLTFHVDENNQYHVKPEPSNIVHHVNPFLVKVIVL